MSRNWPPLEERLWAKVDIGPDLGGCWPWTGHTVEGYGSIFGNGRAHKVHRLVYELLVGPIPPGLVIDHTCHNADDSCPGGECPHRACCNPTHLEPTTIPENAKRGRLPERRSGVHALNRAKTHCLRGHPLSGDNLYVHRGKRSCLECRRAAGRRRRVRAA